MPRGIIGDCIDRSGSRCFARSYLSLNLFTEARAKADAGLALGVGRLVKDAHEVAIGRLLIAEVP